MEIILGLQYLILTFYYGSKRFSNQVEHKEKQEESLQYHLEWMGKQLLEKHPRKYLSYKQTMQNQIHR